MNQIERRLPCNTPHRGELIAGSGAPDIPLDEHRREIGLVPQESLPFSDTKTATPDFCATDAAGIEPVTGTRPRGISDE